MPGSPSALSDLVAPLAARGVQAEVNLPEGLDLSAEHEALLYRVAQEGVRNAIKHADPGRVDIVVLENGNRVVLWVIDDGVGFAVDQNGAERGAFRDSGAARSRRGRRRRSGGRIHPRHGHPCPG